ncbi:endonuclease VII domain-containing protein (plasmid) [Actinacidiphila glaucinigra]|uniref:endonuclease domain-containing protein n=1 Tax=Actinacidiphila glaucinigra TaxID=235986 RepID=UPI002DDC4F96|nr:endonuclease domain-containing protein [Actinacidiphila glaucinigra]WSD65791.1 endonuclease VII domain-containing protein [Actinacidiphila glaucinigra]
MASALAQVTHFLPTVPWGADYQRRPIGGPSRCQSAGRHWGSFHAEPPRAPRRPWHGPLTEIWPFEGRVPRWYVWWRLFAEQDGHCATCPGPAEVVDHNHHSGLVRGLLCYDCNHTESLHAREVALGIHRVDRCWFQDYWDTPPGRAFGWYWPHAARSTTSYVLPSPPPWSTRTPAPRACRSSCPERTRTLLSGGVFVRPRRGVPAGCSARC